MPRSRTARLPVRIHHQASIAEEPLTVYESVCVVSNAMNQEHALMSRNLRRSDSTAEGSGGQLIATVAQLDSLLCLWLAGQLYASNVVLHRRFEEVKISVRQCRRKCSLPDVIFTARCTSVQSAVLRLHVVRPSVRLSVCPPVCDVGESGPHRLAILETNCTYN